MIVGDLGDRWDYEVLNRAFRRLMDGAELIALQKNRYWETAEGLSLDAGPFVAALEYATGREAEVIGKPSPAFFELALGELGVSADRAAMVGDDVEADVGGAMDAGLAGILVTHRQVPGGSGPGVRDRADARRSTRSPTCPAALDLASAVRGAHRMTTPMERGSRSRSWRGARRRRIRFGCRRNGLR